MHARSLKLVIEYDGTDFAGWQVQPGLRTVQGALEEAFSDLAGVSTKVVGAGRTDAGAHALGQVASVETEVALEAASVAAALNARLDEDVLIRSVEEAAPGFNARFDATSRRYVYLIGLSESPIWRRRRWFVRGALDVPAVKSALLPLRGEMDFAAFCLAGSDPSHHRCRIDEISLELDERLGGLLILRVEANRFLRGMVRSIVGTLVEVGRGKMPPGEIATILESGDRGRAGPTAPPWGLYLETVKYDGGAA